MTRSIVGKLTLFVGVLVGLNTALLIGAAYVTTSAILRDQVRDRLEAIASDRQEILLHELRQQQERVSRMAGWAPIRGLFARSGDAGRRGSRRRPARSSPTSRRTRRTCWHCGSRTAAGRILSASGPGAWSSSCPGRSGWRRNRRPGTAWWSRPVGSRGRMRWSSPARCAMTTAGCWGTSCWPPTWGPVMAFLGDTHGLGEHGEVMVGVEGRRIGFTSPCRPAAIPAWPRSRGRSSPRSTRRARGPTASRRRPTTAVATCWWPTGPWASAIPTGA